MSELLAPRPLERSLLRHGDVLIALLVVLAYWPLASFGWSISAGDTLDCWLPWRHFMTQALGEGQFPVWNPYQQGGYPFYADLQGPAWYVEALALGGTIGHSISTMQVLFLGYVVVGGWGMRRLTQELTGIGSAALLAGTAYALSGFFTAHTQHFYSIISAAWMPWLLWAQLRLLREVSLRSALRAAVFQYLLLTGGNHTFTIIGSYLLFALTLLALWKAWRSVDRRSVWRIMRTQLVFAVVAGAMACGTIWSAIEVWPSLSRAQGLGYELASVNPFPWKAWSSLLFPFASTAAGAELGVDPAMANGYFGILPLLGLLFIQWRQRTSVERTFLVFAGICALASVGAALPVHRWLHDIVPGMNVFRFPSYFWLFTIIGVLPISCAALCGAIVEKGRLVRLSRALVVVFAGVAGGMLFLYFRSGPDQWTLFKDAPTFLQRMQRPSFVERLLWSGVIMGCMLLLYLLVAARKKDLRWPFLLLLVSTEMFMAVQCCQWTTSLFDHRPGEIQARVDECPQGPVLPELSAMNDSTDGARRLHVLWRNTHDFLAAPSHDGFNSFWLADHQRLMDKHPQLFAAMGTKPFVHLTDRFVPVMEKGTGDTIVRASEEVWTDVGQLMQGDTLELIAFAHDGFRALTRTTKESFLLVQQNAFPGWSIRVDDAPVELVHVNVACFGTVVPAGTHMVDVRFSKPAIMPLLGFSMLVFFGTLLFLSMTGDRTGRAARITSVLVLSGMVAWPFEFHSTREQRISKGLSDMVDEQAGADQGAFVLLNTDLPWAKELVTKTEQLRSVRAEGWSAMDRVFQGLPAALPEDLTWVDAGLRMPAEVQAFLRDHYALVDAAAENEDVQWWRMERLGDTEPDERNDMTQTQDPIFLNAGSAPFGPAFRTHELKPFLEQGAGVLIDLEVGRTSKHSTSLVVEWKNGDVTLDYEAVPLIAGTTGAEPFHPAYVVRPVPSAVKEGCELVVYVWQQGADTVEIRNLRIRPWNREAGRWRP